MDITNGTLVIKERDEEERPVEEEPEKLSIEEEEEPPRPRKITLDDLIEVIFDDLESQWKLKEKQIGVGHGEEKPQKEAKLVGENRDEEEWEPKSNSSNRQPSTKDSQPEMPEDLKNHIQEMAGRNVKFLTQKTMCKSDEVSHMPVPIQQILTLTEEEERMFSEEGIRMEVEVVEPSLQHSHIPIRKWKSKYGHNYVFTCKNWTDLVQRNALEKGTIVQLWSFRNIDSKLCFAVVRV